MVEPMITLARATREANRRLAFARLRDADVVVKLFDDWVRASRRAGRLHAHPAHDAAGR